TSLSPYRSLHERGTRDSGRETRRPLHAPPDRLAISSYLSSRPPPASHVPSLAPHLRNDFLGNRLGNLVVDGELHRVVAAPLSHRAQGRRVAEHLRERYPGLDHLRTRAQLRLLDVATARAQVAGDGAVILLGHDDFDVH